MKKEEKVEKLVEEKIDEKVEEMIEGISSQNETVEKGLEIIDKLDDEIEVLQQKLVEEKMENVELHAEIEKEKEEIVELENENQKLKKSISIFRLVLFSIFTVIVFGGGWILGSSLVYLDQFLYGEDEQINPVEDKEINFVKTTADVELDKFYGKFLSKRGFISKILNNENIPEYYDMFNIYEYRLSVVPRFDEKLYGDTVFPYVTYDSFQKSYKQIYNLQDLEIVFNNISNYPKLVDGNKVLFDDYLDTGVNVSFDTEKIMYTASDMTYTMTGNYKEAAGTYSVLYGTVVTGTFELKYKMDDVGNKYIIGMIITKEDMSLSSDRV